MPYVRTLRDRVEKFSAKVVAETVGARFGQVESIAKGRMLQGTSVMVTIREQTRNILEKEGVPAGNHAIYYSFAFKLASKAFSHSGGTLLKIAEGLKSWWVNTHGADPTILDKIINLIIPA